MIHSYSNSRPCSGCLRRIQGISCVYCLDCQNDLSDIEDEAYQKGLQTGQSVVPMFVIRGLTLDIQLPEYEIDRYLIPNLHTFLIHSQELRVYESIKRTYYTDSFVKGFWVGYRKTYNNFRRRQQCCNEVVKEVGRRMSPAYLSKYFQKQAPVRRQLLDMNLIAMIKKFI